MSTASWAQFIVFVALVFAGAPLLGWYMAKVYGDEKKAPGDRVFRPVERLIYRICGVDEKQEQRWTDLRVLGDRVQHLQSVVPLRPACGSKAPAAESERLRRSGAPPVVEHRGQLHDEHQLAVVCRRSDHEQPLADARARGPELHVGRGRHGGDGRPHPRPRPSPCVDPGQLLGRPHAHDDADPPPARVRVRARCSSARA